MIKQKQVEIDLSNFSLQVLFKSISLRSAIGSQSQENYKDKISSNH